MTLKAYKSHHHPWQSRQLKVSWLNMEPKRREDIEVTKAEVEEDKAGAEPAGEEMEEVEENREPQDI